MSKYEELEEICKAAIKRNVEYRQELLGFTLQFGKQFCEYVGCEKDRVTYVPVIGKAEDGQSYSMFGAMKHENDGLWNVGIVLHIDSAKLLYHITFKRSADHYTVRAAPDDRDFSVGLGELANFDAVAARMLALAREFLERDPWSPPDGLSRKIGFVQPTL